MSSRFSFWVILLRQIHDQTSIVDWFSPSIVSVSASGDGKSNIVKAAIQRCAYKSIKPHNLKTFSTRDLDHNPLDANRALVVSRGRSPSRRRLRTRLQRNSFPNFCSNGVIPLEDPAVNATRPPGFLGEL